MKFSRLGAVVRQRDRFNRCAAGRLNAALGADLRRVAIAHSCTATDDLVVNMIRVRTQIRVRYTDDGRP